MLFILYPAIPASPSSPTSREPLLHVAAMYSRSAGLRFVPRARTCDVGLRGCYPSASCGARRGALRTGNERPSPLTVAQESPAAPRSHLLAAVAVAGGRRSGKMRKSLRAPRSRPTARQRQAQHTWHRSGSEQQWSQGAAPAPRDRPVVSRGRAPSQAYLYYNPPGARRLGVAEELASLAA